MNDGKLTDQKKPKRNARDNFNTTSDLSTTVVAQSQHNDTIPRPFVEAGAGVISDTLSKGNYKHENYSAPRKHMKKDWMKKQPNLMTNSINNCTAQGSVGQKRYSLIRSVSRGGFKRSSTRSLLN